MAFEKPPGKYAEQMLSPDGWPDVDEQAFLQRAKALTNVLRQLSQQHELWLHEKADITSGAIWAGSGASAGGAAIAARISNMSGQQRFLVTAISWLNAQFSNILSTKVGIFERVVATESAIANLEVASLKPDVRQQNIDELVAKAHEQNVADVTGAASSARFADWNVTDEQFDRGLDQLLRPEPGPAGPLPNSGPSTRSNAVGSQSPVANSEPPAAISPTGDIKSGINPDSAPAEKPEESLPPPALSPEGDGQMAMGTNTPPAAAAHQASPPPAASPHGQTQSGIGVYGPPPATPRNSLPSAPGSTPPASISPSTGQPATPISTGSAQGGIGGSTAPSIGGTQGPSGLSGTGGAPQTPAATAGAGAGQAPVSTPQQDFQKGFADVTKAANANPMPVNQTPLSPAAPASAPAAPVYQQADTTGSTAPAAATNHSAPVTNAPAPATPAAPAAPTGAPPMPLGNPSTPAPAAPVPPTGGPAGPTVAPASTNQGAAGGAAAPVPISAARAERDAMAAAATAGALRRRGNNPRQLARHIGAALNVGITDPSLFWITAVTSDGQILTANNYGLAYIPEHVHLPEQVRMVTADESIPAQTRGTWATYPLLAVQEWARHHNVTLQAVAGTEENLKGFDLGAARDILTPEDMPDSGKMQGRNRLEVIAPEVATKLAGISASGLAELLPPAPADNAPPPDHRINLLLEVCKPLLSANPDRAGAHLKAMIAYADHLQTVALHRAHNAADADLQRTAIADWIYWQHISVLSSDALSAMVS